MLPHPPQEIRFCRSRDGIRIAYVSCGKGPPLLWAQHWIHHLDLDWESTIWRPWLDLLSARFTVVRYDWRGCGLSDRDGVTFSFKSYIEDMEAVAEASGLERFILFGMSNGAHTAATFAARHPERVSHLVLQACQSRGRLACSPTRPEIDEVEARIKMIALAWPNQHPAYSDFSPALHMPEASAAHKLAHNDLLRRITSPDNAVALIHAIAWSDQRADLARIACPTLLLHSRGDQIIAFDEGRAAAALIPGARFIPLESRNHVLVEDEPAWQRFVGALDDFLPRLPLSGMAGGAFLESLTARESEVLNLLAEGLDNATIADSLGNSEKTVRNQVSTIFSKLGVSSRAQAVVRARYAGFGRKASSR
jgi:pimeloyl-ACP methyl ester carboxylesterase/DNA-binding CsgD family transcriptional regulator